MNILFILWGIVTKFKTAWQNFRNYFVRNG